MVHLIGAIKSALGGAPVETLKDALGGLNIDIQEGTFEVALKLIGALEVAYYAYSPQTDTVDRKEKILKIQDNFST